MACQVASSGEGAKKPDTLLRHALPAGRGRAAPEEIGDEERKVRHVYSAGAVDVGCLHDRWRRAAFEEPVDKVGEISDVHTAVIIDIATDPGAKNRNRAVE